MRSFTNSVIKTSLLISVMLIIGISMAGCRQPIEATDPIEPTDSIELGGDSYLCTGEELRLDQNIPTPATEDDSIVLVVFNFQEGVYTDDAGNTRSGAIVFLAAWLDEDPEASYYPERLGIGDQMEYRGYRFTLLQVGKPSGGAEPDGSVYVCVESVSGGETTTDGAESTP